MFRKLALASLAFSVPGLALTVTGERLIRPRLFYHGGWNPDPPDSVGWPYEEATIYTADGLELQGWYFPPKDRGRPTILFMHGTSYNASDMWLGDERPRAFYDFLHGIRAGFLVFDYRGYGRNSGTPSEEGTYTDAAGALGWLLQREDVDPETVFYYGFSLGTGIAAGLAQRERPRGLILRAPFTSIRDVACSRYPRLRALFSLAPWLPLTNYDTLGKIRHVQCPVLVMHGDSDKTVPPSLGQQVFEAAPEPKMYVSFPGSGHSDVGAHLVVPPITQFMDDVLGKREASLAKTAAGG
jgi:pimeloyl-ACP methyl ester carboxylesterase